MMKWCRSFKMKTAKIKGFSGHHDRQGCIQSPVHKNKKYEQRLEDFSGCTTFPAIKTICFLQNYDSILSPAPSDHLIFQLPQAKSLRCLNNHSFCTTLLSSSNPRFVNPIDITSHLNLSWCTGGCQHLWSIGNSASSFSENSCSSF